LSFGFRPGRGAHDALHQAREYGPAATTSSSIWISKSFSIGSITT
jgi:retron-type reverse transcriptase